jgi:hypothetical protein
VHQTTTIDGRPVNAPKLVAASGAYPAHAAHKNILALPAGNGRSAAYGYGLLLTGFAKDTHTIHLRAGVGGAKWDITYTVRAQ